MRNDDKMLSRRQFTKQTTTVLAGIPLLHINGAFASSFSTANDKLEINLFSKHLQFLDYNEMSAQAA